MKKQEVDFMQRHKMTPDQFGQFKQAASKIKRIDTLEKHHLKNNFKLITSWCWEN